MLEKELGALKSLWEVFADRLLDYARPGKTDERAGLGDHDIALHRQTCGHAAHRGVGKNRNIWKAGLREGMQSGGYLGQLHQREKRLLHARAPGGGKVHQRHAMFAAVACGANELFAHYRTHGSPHEAELESAGHKRLPVQLAGHGHQGFQLAAVVYCLRDPVRVALGVPELQRVLGLKTGRKLPGRVAVQEQLQPSPGPQAHVMLALGAHMLDPLHFGPVKLRSAGIALDPDAFRHALLRPSRRDPRRH